MLTLMKRENTDNRPTERTGGLWSNWRTRLAIGVIALLLLMTIFLVVLRPDPKPQATPRPSPAPSASSTAVPAGGASICGLPPGDQSVPSVPPVSTDWELVGSVAAPTAAKSIGPGMVTNALRSCYARSPLGALYAATGFLATTSQPALRLPAVQNLTAKGAGRDRALDLIEGADPGPATGGVQVAGFTFLNWDAKSSVIDVALRSGGSAAHLPVSLRWEDGDWKVIFPPSGDLYSSIAAIPNLTGYVPWAGS